MMFFLLKTKLHIPQLPSNGIPRQRLIDALNQGTERRLTLISAPPGSGKSTLVSTWARQSSHDVAWLRLDAGDNDPVRFWRYVVLALQKLQPDITQDTIDSLPAEQAPAFIVNVMVDVHTPATLVLDDYHLIEHQQIHDGIGFLLDYLPEQIHLVIVTRIDPPLLLGRLRVRGQLLEIRAEDLRFTPEESYHFLCEAMGLNLTQEQIHTLEQKTQGWIAGLHLAGLSLQDEEDANAFIDAFTGTNRYVMDYLVEEVLNHQPEAVRDFLLKTSILDLYCAPLCDFICGIDNSQTILEMLERHNQFFTPLDDKRQWYTCHQLFADLLRYRLQQSGDVLALHRRASEWYSAHDMLPQAVDHALLSGDEAHTAALIEASADAMWSRSELATFARWIDHLPQEALYNSPRLCVYVARARVSTGPMDSISALLNHAEQQLADDIVWLGYIDTIRSHCLRFAEDLDQAQVIATRALERIPEHHLDWRSFAQFSLSTCLYGKGELRLAERSFAEVVTLAQGSKNYFGLYVAIFARAEILLFMGYFDEALAVFEAYLDGASPIHGWADIGLGMLNHERGNFEEAHHHIERGLAKGKMGGIGDLILRGYARLTQIHLSLGDIDRAQDYVQQMMVYVQPMNMPMTIRWAQALEARIWMAKGELDLVRQWADTLTLDPAPLTFIYQFEYLTYLRALMAWGDTKQAISLIDERLKIIGEHLLTEVELHTLKALALAQSGEQHNALASLKRALSLAAPCRLVRVFRDEGAPLHLLLDKLKNVHLYAQTLLGEIATHLPEGLMEALTEREMAILQAIADGASNADIAEVFVISVATVKKHISNLFLKLNANNRTQAVARAREWQILP